MKPRLRAFLALVLVVVPAAASAPDTQYDAFDRNSTTITDHYTLLEWDRVHVQSFDYADAAFACANSIFPTSKPGRIPTVKELLTLLDETPHQEYEHGAFVSKMIDAKAFPATPVDQPYWSSTPGTTAGTVRLLDFGDGRMTELATAPTTTKAYVRCVR